MSKRISLIGAGNVAWNLSHAFDLAGYTIHEIFSKSITSAERLAKKFGAFYGDDLCKIDSHVDLVLLCVPDHAIPEVLPTLQHINLFIAHTSGTSNVDILRETGFKGGVFYPLQSLTKDKCVSLEKIPLLVEGVDSKSQMELKALAQDISSNVHECDSEQRQKIHIAAVMANNFSNHLYHLAEAFLKDNDLDPSLLRPLMSGTGAKYKDHSPSQLQTGPAVRGDQNTIAQHLQALADKPELKALYESITASIQKHHPK